MPRRPPDPPSEPLPPMATPGPDLLVAAFLALNDEEQGEVILAPPFGRSARCRLGRYAEGFADRPLQGRGSCLRSVAFGFVSPLPHGMQPPRELPLEVNVEHLAREVPP